MNELRYFDRYIDKINHALEKELELYSWSEFYEPLRYACSNGKRLRPLMLILSAESIGNYSDDIYLAAVAVELLHTESIIHDDIIDSEVYRRGKIPFYLKYGYNFSILTADFVLGMILNIVSKIGNLDVAKELSKAALHMSEGEVIEIKVNDSITLADYIKILEYKTASLFEVSTKIGAILANGNKEEIDTLTEFGRCIGIAYQIQDDIKDWKNEDRQFKLLSYSTYTSDRVLNDMYNLYIKYLNMAEASLSVLKNRLSLGKLLDLTKNELKLDR